MRGVGIGPGLDRVPDALLTLRGQPWSLSLQSPVNGLHPTLPQPPEHDTALAEMSTDFLIFIPMPWLEYGGGRQHLGVRSLPKRGT